MHQLKVYKHSCPLPNGPQTNDGEPVKIWEVSASARPIGSEYNGLMCNTIQY